MDPTMQINEELTEQVRLMISMSSNTIELQPDMKRFGAGTGSDASFDEKVDAILDLLKDVTFCEDFDVKVYHDGTSHQISFAGMK